MHAVAEFGANPGNLGMFACVPRGAASPSALVVALHGCQQSAREFDQATGWSALGSDHGFAVLFPEQKCQNNPQNCFNWFIEKHIRSHDGEIASIRGMIEKMLREYGLDRRRIFVTGLSAGGAMACALLASCPDLFAAGAVIAGLPYGAALGPMEAMKAMAFGTEHSPRELGNLVRQAAPRQRSWPRISIWHGSQDEVVTPANASALVRQWLDIHQVDEEGVVLDEVDGQIRRSWRDGAGKVVVEHYAIDGMAHGLPIDSWARQANGAVPPFALDAGISSTIRIAKSWELLVPPGVQGSDAPPAPNAENRFHFLGSWFKNAGASK
ncbi:MAG: PHB depolymerase family esterase [Beijerinckiaceae bacterium]|nr:PHB depolymerase family esterase [Beijerinckiaceae bacterium]